MGSVWVMNETQVDRWKQVGPERILCGLGVPKGPEQEQKTDGLQSKELSASQIGL